MLSITESVIQRRLDRQAADLEMSLRVTGQIFETLPLSLGDTTIERELLPDGSRGAVRICTQEAQGLLGSVVIYKRYVLEAGEIINDPKYGEAPIVLRGIRKAKLLSKVVFGRVDHWDRETDFFVEEDEE